jgi:FKBP-type peptidyl-prolyl cis-trans isomerase
MVILGRKRVDCNQFMRDGQPGKGTEVTAGEDVSLQYKGALSWWWEGTGFSAGFGRGEIASKPVN